PYHWQMRSHPASERLQNPHWRGWRASFTVAPCGGNSVPDETQEHEVSNTQRASVPDSQSSRGNFQRPEAHQVGHDGDAVEEILHSLWRQAIARTIPRS